MVGYQTFQVWQAGTWTFTLEVSCLFTIVWMKVAKRPVSLAHIHKYFCIQQIKHIVKHACWLNRVPKSFLEDSCGYKSSHGRLLKFKCLVTKHVMFHTKLGLVFFVCVSRPCLVETDGIHDLGPHTPERVHTPAQNWAQHTCSKTPSQYPLKCFFMLSQQIPLMAAYWTAQFHGRPRHPLLEPDTSH